MDSTLVALVSVPGILALTNLAKHLGVKGKWSALVAVLLGVGLNVARYHLASSGAWQAVEAGTIMGLGAAGLWDFVNEARKPPRYAMQDTRPVKEA